MLQQKHNFPRTIKEGLSKLLPINFPRCFLPLWLSFKNCQCHGFGCFDVLYGQFLTYDDKLLLLVIRVRARNFLNFYHHVCFKNLDKLNFESRGLIDPFVLRDWSDGFRTSSHPRPGVPELGLWWVNNRFLLQNFCILASQPSCYGQRSTASAVVLVDKSGVFVVINGKIYYSRESAVFLLLGERSCEGSLGITWARLNTKDWLEMLNFDNGMLPTWKETMYFGCPQAISIPRRRRAVPTAAKTSSFGFWKRKEKKK